MRRHRGFAAVSGHPMKTGGTVKAEMGASVAYMGGEERRSRMIPR